MNLAFIGLGNMGGPMARHLARSENALRVYDLNPEAVARLSSAHSGVGSAGSYAELVKDADVVFASLPGPPEVEAVVLGPGGLAETMRPGSIYVDLTTDSPEMARRASASLATKGIAMLDAPVSGGVQGAEAGTLGIMCGGERDTFDKVEDLLDIIGGKVVYCGEAGAGCVVKLCNNLASSSYGLILAEALTLGVKAGVDLEVLASAIGASTGSSPRLTVHFPNYLFKRNFTPGFSANLSAKDTRLGLELAEQNEVPMFISNYLREQTQEVLDRGWGNEDFDAVVKLQEERAGVELNLADE